MEAIRDALKGELPQLEKFIGIKDNLWGIQPIIKQALKFLIKPINSFP
jgi:hypothetical protein